MPPPPVVGVLVAVGLTVLVRVSVDVGLAVPVRVGVHVQARDAYISRSAAIRQMLAWALAQAQDIPGIKFTAS